MRLFFCLYITLLFCGSCNNNKQPTEPSTGPSEQTDSQPGDSVPSLKTIVPGKMVGGISPTTSEAELKKIYGAANVSSKELDAGEGNIVVTTLLYPGSPNEVQITWKDPAGLKDPDRIRIQQKGSEWNINNQINIGTSLATLEQLNKKPFYITGCCFDAPFAIIDWNNGELEYFLQQGVGIRLHPAKAAEDLKKKIIGDKKYLVTDTLIQRSNMSVAEFFIRFK